MKTILILGAGLSSSSLIRYLLQHAEAADWNVRIVDRNLEMLLKKIGDNPRGTALSFNALERTERLPEIEKADLVISMLPAKFHPEVAEDCIILKKNLITPSYVSSEMLAMHQKAKDAGIIILNEIGVDPGIDHMSAMKIIDEIKEEGGHLLSFKSYCGGLISPESDNNPWNYKFTWNPRNVVLAAQGSAAKYIENGEYKYLPYSQIFKRIETIEIDGYGAFEGYANRDSLSYRSVYGLDDIGTIFRGTLRRKDYCAAWNVFVELGMTDDSYVLADAQKLSPRKFLNTFLPYDPIASVEEKFIHFLGKERAHLFSKFEWLDLFDDGFTIGFEGATPAQLLEKILVDKWLLCPGDKDMLVMYHEFQYEKGDAVYQITSSMVNLGEDQIYTSMSNTVGLPVAIAAKNILNGKFSERGVVVPVSKEIYETVLEELEDYGISFQENKNLLKKAVY